MVDRNSSVQPTGPSDLGAITTAGRLGDDSRGRMFRFVPRGLPNGAPVNVRAVNHARRRGQLAHSFREYHWPMR